jgi:hypothetical protein
MATKQSRQQLVAEYRRTYETQHVSLTPVRAEDDRGSRVHIGFDEGSYDSKPLCPALANRATETTDTPANCTQCAGIVRDMGLEYLIKDEDGWTGLYEPRRR